MVGNTSGPKVKIYSTPSCIYCRLAKEFFRQNNVEFEEFNVAEDAEKGREMIEKSGQQGVPVIDINGTVIVGFDRPAIKEALGL